jgi:catalase
MNGYYGHTLKVVNKAGEWKYVQFHLKSDQGIKTLTNEEAAQKSPDYGQADLFNAVSSSRVVGLHQLTLSSADQKRRLPYMDSVRAGHEPARGRKGVAGAKDQCRE